MFISHEKHNYLVIFVSGRKSSGIMKPYRRVDLHVRTTASMGRVTSYEAVQLAKEAGLAAIAIVDHDTVEGISLAQLAAESYRLEIISGVEFSYETLEHKVHLIGYFIDHKNADLVEVVETMQVWRSFQIETISKKLRKQGVAISFDDVLREAGHASVVRTTHIAKALVGKGFSKSENEAFEKYLSRGHSAFTSRRQLELKELVQIIRNAGGVVGLAHPKFGHARQLLPKLVKLGLAAIEVYHPTHSIEDIRTFQRLARRYKLIEVGGSDFETERSPVGAVTVPYSAVEQLKKKHKRRLR